MIKAAAALAALALVGVFTTALNPYTRLFALAVAALVFAAVALRRTVGRSPEFGFLAVALICGSLLSVTEPRNFNSWDELIHYQRAENIASVLVPDLYFRPDTTSSSYSIEQQNKIDTLVDGSYQRSRRKPTFYDLTYNKVGYLPSAIALAIGSWIHLPHHLCFVVGRWMNVVLYSLVVFFAIRKLATGKMIMSVIALFPTSIFLASNYNYDSWVTAFTMLGLAYLFGGLQRPDKRLTVCEMCLMLGAFVVGLGPKAIYFPLMLLLFLLRPDKFTSPMHHKYFTRATALSTVLVICSFVLPFVFSGIGGNDKRGGDAVNSAEQVKFILGQPLVYIKILLGFMLKYFDPTRAGRFTTFFSYLGMANGVWVVLGTLGLAALTDKNRHDEATATWRIRSSVVAVFLATVSLIATALYVSFTPVGSPGISGVQPRYLIPLLFPLFLVSGSSRLKIPFNRDIYHSALFTVMAFVMMLGIWDRVVSRYY